MDSTTIKSTEIQTRLYNRDGKYNIPPRFFRNRVEKWLRLCKNNKNWHIPARFPLQSCWYVPVFFLKMAAAIRCYPIPKFNCCCTTKIHLLLPNPKSNISNSTHTKFKIQNPISLIQHIVNSKVSTKTTILSIDKNII